MIEYSIAILIGILCGWLGANKTNTGILRQYLYIAAGIIGGTTALWISKKTGLQLSNNIINAECSSVIGAVIFTELLNLFVKKYLLIRAVAQKRKIPLLKQLPVKLKLNTFSFSK